MAYKGDIDGVVRMLGEEGSAVVPPGPAEEALRVAAVEGHLSVVKHLLGEGAEINGQDIIGRTALHHAIMHLQKEVMELLVHKGADIEVKENKGLTPIGLAKDKGDDAAMFVFKFGKE